LRSHGTTAPRTALSFLAAAVGIKKPNGVYTSMDFSSLGSLLGSLSLDDSSLALIALLAGMAGGWTLTNWRDQQLRTKKLKAKK
jgi:uncharacterized membrane protein YidH (DUF202 family)